MCDTQPNRDSLDGIIKQMSAAVAVYVSGNGNWSPETYKARVELYDALMALTWHWKRLANMSHMLSCQLLSSLESQVAVSDNMVIARANVASVKILTTNLGEVFSAVDTMTDIVVGICKVNPTVPSARVLSLPLWADLVKSRWNIMTNEMLNHGLPYSMGSYPLPEDTLLVINLGGTFVGNIKEWQIPPLPPYSRLFVQASQETIASAPQFQNKDLEFMPYDSFTPQPVKGARIYYYGWAFTGQNDQDTQTILRNLKPAFVKGYSQLRILCCTKSVQLQTDSDISTEAVDERDESQWDNLLRKEGFVIINREEIEHGVNITADLCD